MTGLLDRLPAEGMARLRSLGRLAEDVQWPSLLARTRGWRVANEAYQGYQRSLGLVEMRLLLGALDLSPPLDTALARDVLVAAIELFLHTEETGAQALVEGEGSVRVDVDRCPLFPRFLDDRWFGLTACGCFSRRRGWYQALGVHADEELLMTRKWGDPVCELTIRLPVPAAVAA